MWVDISQSGPLATGNFKWCYFDRRFVPWYAISIWISLCCSVISLVSCFIQLQFTKFHSMNCLKKYFFYSFGFSSKLGFVFCTVNFFKKLGFLDSCAKSFLSFAQFSNWSIYSDIVLVTFWFLPLVSEITLPSLTNCLWYEGSVFYALCTFSVTSGHDRKGEVKKSHLT